MEEKERVFRCTYLVGKYDIEVTVDVVADNAMIAKSWCMRQPQSRKILKCVEIK